MKTLAVAAVASIAMLVAGTELVRAQDNALTTDDYPIAGDAPSDVVTTMTKPLIPWETRDTGFAAPTDAAKRLIRQLHYTSTVSQYASEYGVPAELAQAVIQIESNFRPTVKGDAGEIGLMQSSRRQRG